MNGMEFILSSGQTDMFMIVKCFKNLCFAVITEVD